MWFSNAGVVAPLAGVRVVAPGVQAMTGSDGVASITPGKAQTLELRADRAGYVRSAPVRVHVSG